MYVLALFNRTIVGQWRMMTNDNGTPPTTDEAPAIDADTFYILYESMGEDEPEVMEELIDLFLENGRHALDTMSEAVQQQESHTLYKTAHSLKASSASLGALELSACCLELERLGHAADLVPVPPLLARAEAAYSQARAELEVLRTRLRP
jgi:HPt (histidine-containing phosphotransfer) domain-containing protein